ncbi:MAG TPA: hypothetical protein PLB63_09610 [Planctomycetota bacterium]|nr:hypothetical protein [Planctomycetota bacterium]
MLWESVRCSGEETLLGGMNVALNLLLLWESVRCSGEETLLG